MPVCYSIRVTIKRTSLLFYWLKSLPRCFVTFIFPLSLEQWGLNWPCNAPFVWVLLPLPWMQPTAPGAHSSIALPAFGHPLLFIHFSFCLYMFSSWRTPLSSASLLLLCPPTHHHHHHSSCTLSFTLLLLSRLCLCWLINLLFPYFGPVFHNTCPVHYFALCTFSCLCSLSSILPLQSPPFPLCICSVREKKNTFQLSRKGDTIM